MIDSVNVSVREHTLPREASIREALRRLNMLPGSRMTLFVTDGAGRALGSLTDGDIRRALLRGVDTGASCAEAMHADFRRLGEGDDLFDGVAGLRSSGINPVPVVDSEGRIVRILDLSRVCAMLPLTAVLMAGGRGERLRPLTLETPKPLLKIGGKPIIDYNVDALMRNGVEDIYVTVNYLKEQIISHFNERGDGVRCIAEQKRTGTFGSLSLVPRPRHENVLVMNSDLLTNISFEAMYRRHIETRAALTMAVVPYNVSVPFAIIDTEGDAVTGLREKPVYNYFANAGIYILRSELLSRIAPDAYLDAPDFIEQLIADGLKVSYFPIDGTWIDIGSPEDFARAEQHAGF